MAINKAIILGFVGQAPQVRNVSETIKVADFRLATTEKWKDKNGEAKEQTEWHNVVCFRGLADTVAKYVQKGHQLYVEGKLRTREYEGKTGKQYRTEIVADNIQILTRPASNQAPGAPANPAVNYGGFPTAPATEEVNDDLPF